MKVKDKVILVTGGGNGMGRELVLHLLSKGSKVVAVDVNEVKLIETMALAGVYMNSLMTIKADITDREAIEEIPSKILARFGTIDGIINNAGIIQPFHKVNDMTFDMISRVFNINFMGALNIVKVFTPYLINRPEAHIVNISSMGGFLPVAGQAIYGASKAAVKILSESLTSELSETNVGVTTVFPGAISTNIKANSGLGLDAGAGPEGHAENAAFSPARAAEIMINAIEYKKKRVYIGKDSKLMNILYKFVPAVAVNMIYQKMKNKLTGGTTNVDLAITAPKVA